MEEVIENTITDTNSEENSEENFNEEYQNNLAIFEDIKLPILKYKELTNELSSVTEMLSTVKIDKQKDMDKVEKKAVLLLNLYRELNTNYINFFNKSIVDIKKNIKLEKKKKKENKDKSKYYVNIPKRAPLFVLKMMNKDEEEKVSQSQVLSGLIQKIKKCINNSASNYAVFKESGKIDKTKFKIHGELSDFFDNIKNEAKLRGNDIIIPEIMGYPNLMSYMQYFIYKDTT
jgi:hypothetical protein